jgi:hypothetical protein
MNSFLEEISFLIKLLFSKQKTFTFRYDKNSSTEI